MKPRSLPVADLSARIAAPVPDVVALLRDMLARAESGEVRAVVVGAACAGRHTASAYALGDGTIADLHLGLERAKARLLAAGE